jgi:AcrR family transcriptional regulator
MGRNKTIEDEDVLAAARDVFRKEGHGASTRDVAKAAGISQAVLYQRFGSKDELFFRAMTPEAPDIAALLGPYPPRNARADLLAIAERLLDYLRAFNPTLLKVVAVHGVEVERLRAWHAQLPFIPIVEALADRFRRMAADGLVRPNDPHASAVALISALHALAFFDGLTTHKQRARLKAELPSIVGVLWEGFAPR